MSQIKIEDEPTVDTGDRASLETVMHPDVLARKEM